MRFELQKNCSLGFHDIRVWYYGGWCYGVYGVTFRIPVFWIHYTINTRVQFCNQYVSSSITICYISGMRARTHTHTHTRVLGLALCHVSAIFYSTTWHWLLLWVCTHSYNKNNVFVALELMPLYTKWIERDDTNYWCWHEWGTLHLTRRIHIQACMQEIVSSTYTSWRKDEY